MPLPTPNHNFSKETKSDLPGSIDDYNGVTIDPKSIPTEEELFGIVLQGIFRCFKQKEKKT